MKTLLAFAGIFIVLICLLLAVGALLDHKAKQRELDLTFIGRVTEKFQWESRLYGVTVEDSIGPIVIERVHTSLFDFVEVGDTIIKKDGDPNCLVQNQLLHKHHVFQVYQH